MKKETGNYLEKIPFRNESINWTKNENGIVTLEIENKGIFNKLAQKLLKKPKITYIHLDELGSFSWQMTDGEKDILAIGKDVKEKFGEKAEPLYERLAKFFQIVHSYGFIKFK